MTMDQIECFVAVASTGSISQAAARLYRSQPNLSYTLKQLEAELGYPLLTRTNHGVTLTPSGQEFLSHAQETLQSFRQLCNFSAVRAAESEVSLRVAVMPFCGVTEALRAVFSQETALPAQIVINTCMRDAVMSGLNVRQYDLGFTYAYHASVQSFLTRLEVNGLEAAELCRCRPSALLGQGSPWFQDPPERLTPQQLNTLRRVFFSTAGVFSFTSTQLRDLNGAAGSILCGDQQDIQMVLDTMPAYSLVPCSEALLERCESTLPGLKCVPVEGRDLTGFYYVVYRKDFPPTGLGLRIIDALKAYLEGRAR